MRTLDEDVAMEIGEKPALMLNQILYWISRKQGTPDGYIWNTYEGWRSQENFPWWGIATVRRVLKKLEDLEIIFKRKHSIDKRVHSWDQRREWGLNYSHPLVVLVLSKRSVEGDQNDQPNMIKKIRCYNTDTYPKKTADTTPPVVPTRPSTSKDPYHNSTRTYGELVRDKVSPASSNYSDAKKWLVDLDEIDRDRVEKYVKAQLSNPKIRNPVGYEREVLSQVWRKHMGMENHCDFEVTTNMRQVITPTIQTKILSYEEKVGAAISLDEEMEMLYEQGGIYDG